MSTSTATTSTLRRPAQLVRAGYLGQLNREWVTRHSHQLAAGAGDRSWADVQPALAGLPTLDDVLDAIRSYPAARVDAILHALLTLSAQGDALAGRTLLQTMLGNVQRLIGTAHYRDIDDSASAAIEAMWTAITTYPLQRTTSVAANLALEALRALQKAPSSPLPAGELLEDHLHAQQLSGRLEPAGTVSGRGEGLDALRWAHHTGALNAEDTRLLTLLHLSDTPPTLTQLASELGLPAATLRKRHSRAVRRLAAAVAERCSGVPFAV